MLQAAGARSGGSMGFIIYATDILCVCMCVSECVSGKPQFLLGFLPPPYRES